MGYKEQLAEKQKQLIGERLRFPLAKVQVDQENGGFKIVQDGEVVGQAKSIGTVIVDRYSEFYKYDPKQERRTILSTIEKNATECRDKYTGKLIKDIKAETNDEDIVYNLHLIGIVFDDKGKTYQADLQLHGVGVKQFLEFTKENKKYWSNRLLNKLEIETEKQKTGKVVYYQPVIKVAELTEDEAKTVLENVEEVKKKFEEFSEKYNARIAKPGEPGGVNLEASADIPEEDIGEDEPFMPADF